MEASHRRIVEITAVVAVAAVAIAGCAEAEDATPGHAATSSAPQSTPASTGESPSQLPTIPEVCTPETPQPIPDGAMAYYRYPDEPFYGRVQAMLDSGEYPSLACELEDLTTRPIAIWIDDSNLLNEQVEKQVATIVQAAAVQNEMPLLVAYNIPNRDLGNFSAGGATDPSGYREWATSFSQGIGELRAAVIFEPDSLVFVPDMTDTAQATARLDAMREALVIFKENNPHAIFYVDVGHDAWRPPEEMAELLRRLDNGMDVVKAISANVSSHGDVESTRAYIQAVVAAYGKPLLGIIDSSRNGAPVDRADWCNNRDARLGSPEDFNYLLGADGAVIEEAFIKTPDESDGECEKGDPGSGEPAPERLVGLLN